MTNSYRVLDEPTPGRFAEYVVNPTSIFVAGCLGGGWLALPWFAFNAYALGSVNQKREWRLAALSPILSVVIAFVLFGFIDALALHSAGEAALAGVLGLPSRAGAYAIVVVLAVKVWILYTLQSSQQKSFAIYEYMGGKTRSVAAMAAGAYFLRSFVIKGAFALSFYLGIAVI